MIWVQLNAFLVVSLLKQIKSDLITLPNISLALSIISNITIPNNKHILFVKYVSLFYILLTLNRNLYNCIMLWTASDKIQRNSFIRDLKMFDVDGETSIFILWK